MEKKDTLVLGGHEFTSRFILGSGKFSVDLIKRQSNKVPHKSSPWPCAASKPVKKTIS